MLFFVTYVLLSNKEPSKWPLRHGKISQYRHYLVSKEENLKMKNRKRNKKGGFSLLELLAVVTILGIIAAIIVPRVTGLERHGQAACHGTSQSNDQLGC